MNFDQAIERVLKIEGGYVNDPRDPGGETNFGISKRSYPNEDIKNLTRERAKYLYWQDFWTPLRAEQLHPAVAYQLLDFAVNSGISRAIKEYQRALGVAVDGVFGQASLTAAQTMSETDQIMRVLAVRLKFIKDLRTFAAFGAGWVDRIADDLLYASEDT